jgi:hypothetical protein
MDVYRLAKAALLVTTLQCCDLEDHKHVATRQLGGQLDKWTAHVQTKYDVT